MARSETTWFCDLCEKEFTTKDEAEYCESEHYKLEEVREVGYFRGKKCPQYIIVDIDIGGDIKQVTYVVKQEGWGEK